MRQDTVDLVKKAIEDKRHAYVIVNNRPEGNAPLTIQALMRALQQTWHHCFVRGNQKYASRAHYRDTSFRCVQILKPMS